MYDTLPHDVEVGFRLGHIGRVAADEEGELARGSRRLAAGDGCIQKAHLASSGLSRHLVRKRRIDRAAIHPKAAGPELIEKAISPQRGLGHSRRIAQHGKKDVYLLGDGSRRIRPGRAAGQQGAGLLLGAIVDDQLKASLLQIRSHAAAHDAQADEADFHCGPPLCGDRQRL